MDQLALCSCSACGKVNFIAIPMLHMRSDDAMGRWKSEPVHANGYHEMILKTIMSPAHLAHVLGRNYRKFSYLVYALTGPVKYRSFSISKKGGGERKISAPKWPLLKLQRQLRPMLDALYTPRPAVHGFIKGRSIITNARVHVASRWILNIDLHSFFDSIHFGRINGRLQANPYNLTPSISHAIANAACFSGKLPQGGALSPVLSNMVVDRLDGELVRLCRKYRCRYTRYADDITISTNAQSFPRRLAYFENIGEKRSLVIGDELEAIVKSNGFELNTKKSRLNGRWDRQEVTGLIVNEKLNVPRSFVRQVRAMLNAWEKYGLIAAQTEHLTKWRSAAGRVPLHDTNNFEYILRGKIEFIKSVRGESDLLCRRLLVRFNNLPDRATAIFRVLPISVIELLNENTYCLNFTKFGEGHSASTPSVEHFHGSAFFLEGVGIVTCAHCVGDEMEVYHPARKTIKYAVKCKVKDDIADVAVLELIDTLLIKPKKELGRSSATVNLGDELTVAGFPIKFPDGALSVVRATVDAFFQRADQPVLWRGDTTIRYVVARGIPDGVSGGPVVNSAGLVVGIGAKGPGLDDHLTPSEVIPLSALVRLLARA
jgi:RNA-directed DNA polymerase